MHTALILLLQQRALSSVFKANDINGDVGRTKLYVDFINLMRAFAQIPEGSQ